MRGMTVLLVGGALALAAREGSAQQRIDQRRATTPAGQVRVEGGAASVRIVGSDRNEVAVSGTLASGYSLQWQESAGVTVLRVAMEQRIRNDPGSRLEVRVPAAKGVALNTLSGSASVERVDGAVTVTSISGDVAVTGGRSRQVSASSKSGAVRVEANADQVRATSVSGAVRVTGSARQSVAAESTSGAVTVAAATPLVNATSVTGGIDVAGLSGRAELRSVSGNIRLAGTGLLGTARTVSGRIVANGELGRSGALSITTHSGDVEVEIPRRSSAEVDFTSVSGQLEAEFPGARVTRSSARSQHLVVGSGGAQLVIRTFSGSARLSAAARAASTAPASSGRGR